MITVPYNINVDDTNPANIIDNISNATTYRPSYLCESETSLSDGKNPPPSKIKRGDKSGSSSDSSTDSDSTDSSAEADDSPIENRYWAKLPDILTKPRSPVSTTRQIKLIDVGKPPSDRYRLRAKKHHHITKCMNKVKLKHRSGLQLSDWQRYNYAKDYDIYVDEMVKHCQLIREKHQQGLDVGDHIPVKGIDRIHCNDYSINRFREEYESKSLPVIIQGCANDWNATKSWNYETLMKEPYRNIILKCGEDDDGHSVKVRMKTFLRYMRYQNDIDMPDDSPLYVFDDDYGDREVGKQLLEDYCVPKYFQDDIFRYVDRSRRPPFRWFLVGPKRSGTSLHTDPLATAAWNTVITGRKLWVLFKPDAPRSAVKGKYLRRRGEDFEAITYFRRIIPRIRHIETERNGGLGMIEFIQHPGETVFVPAGWWHAVLNLDDTFAVTQNFASPVNFPHVWKCSRKSRKHMSRRWLSTLKTYYPEMAQVARRLNEEDNFKFNMTNKKQVPPTASTGSDADSDVDSDNIDHVKKRQKKVDVNSSN